MVALSLEYFLSTNQLELINVITSKLASPESPTLEASECLWHGEGNP